MSSFQVDNHFVIFKNIFKITGVDLRVLCINLKVDMTFTRAHLRWTTRWPAICACIDSLNPDVVLLQEITPTSLDDLTHRYEKRYAYFGAFRNPKETVKEGVGILLRRSLFQEPQIQTIWLTDTPMVVSKQKTSLKPRIATVVSTFIHDQTIHLVSLHLDPLFPWVRNRQIQCLLNTIDLSQILILGGDFNGTANEKWFHQLNQTMHYVQTDNDHNTLHYGSGKITSKLPIDFLFVKPGLTIKHATIIDHDYGGIYPSDHFPLFMVLTIDAF